MPEHLLGEVVSWEALSTYFAKLSCSDIDSEMAYHTPGSVPDIEVQDKSLCPRNLLPGREVPLEPFYPTREQRTGLVPVHQIQKDVR